MKIRRPRSTTEEQRFWMKVDLAGPVPERRPDLGPCWLWTGALNDDGYGRFYRRMPDGRQRNIRAHRWSFEAENGPIPEGLEPDHLCRVRRCVRPSHLEAVPGGVNGLRGTSPWALNAQKTHCINGHEFNAANTRYSLKRGRECRICRREHRRAQLQRDRVVRTTEPKPADNVLSMARRKSDPNGDRRHRRPDYLNGRGR